MSEIMKSGGGQSVKKIPLPAIHFPFTQRLH